MSIVDDWSLHITLVLIGASVGVVITSILWYRAFRDRK